MCVSHRELLEVPIQKFIHYDRRVQQIFNIILFQACPLSYFNIFHKNHPFCIFSYARKTILQIREKGSSNFTSERSEHRRTQLHRRLRHFYGPSVGGAYIDAVHLFNYAGNIYSLQISFVRFNKKIIHMFSKDVTSPHQWVAYVIVAVVSLVVASICFSIFEVSQIVIIKKIMLFGSNTIFFRYTG